ncbi:permease [Pseudoduganella sp. FT93W]|uniref:Permease n=1 Tax=Duganella fentianensis TaxID=2692177 RepID=A0A845I3B6_9BURK|nr:permease [Duganella fentianensis]MYN45636.1 permease [Duganella fentianensis]
MSGASVPRRVLSFDSNPPYTLPLRFFLSAPLFVLLACALLFWQGDAALASRWSPYTLAITHLLVLGCISMTMLGALMQMLPVVAGISLPAVLRIGPLVHAGLCGGSLLLGAAFCWQLPWLFIAAGLLLLATLLLFVGACTIGLWQQPDSGAAEVVAAIRQSLAALLVTITLGALLASAFVWPAAIGLPLQLLTDLHALWGLLGWVGLLVMGIAWQVVPMFMVTEPYPLKARSRVSTTLFLLLCAVSMSSTLSGAGQSFHQLALALLVLGYGGFAGLTLYLLARRKRPSADTTTLYWRTAMAFLLLAGLLALLIQLPAGLLPYALPVYATELAIGVLLLTGVALCAINGMLYKIVPFLTWYHLQETRALGNSVPNVNQIIPPQHGRWQYYLHGCAVLLLLAACYAPALLCRPAAALMALASLALCANLLTAVRLYRRLRRAVGA